jgi:hypothetical protein
MEKLVMATYMHEMQVIQLTQNGVMNNGIVGIHLEQNDELEMLHVMKKENIHYSWEKKSGILLETSGKS